MPDIDLSRLSLEQKAALLSGQDFWSTRSVADAGLPSVVLTDGPHGVRRQVGEFDHMGIYESLPSTCFPPAVAVGSSWDPEVARRVGAAVGREARALGVQVALGPGVNIKRSPLCGRNFEYYSEDPLLSGHLGAAHVRGQQEQGVGASLKHFAVNNQETDRMRVSADVDERTLREIYLPAFEHIVTEAGPATVMAAYNKVNGVHAAQNRWLLTEVLREEWGFTGAVVSDWGAVHDPVASLLAGLDLEMPGPSPDNTRRIVDAVRAGELDESVVDTAVRRLLALTGLVAGRSDEGDAAQGADGGEGGDAADGFDVDAHHRLARELAAECAVLLKNDDAVLPLAPAQRIAVIGEFAATPRYQAGGSSHLDPTRLDNALDAIRESAAGRGGSVEFAPGFTLDGSGDAVALREAAVAVARASDVAVVFAGLAESEESEGFDREHLRLPAAQIELIRAVAAAAARTVVVLSNGGIVSLEGWHDEADAILEGFLLGQGGGGAVADLLFGAADPSGRLAETIPLRLEDNPSFVNFPGEQGHVRHGEGVMVGYRWYTTTGAPVRHPFGHGLSYTTFEVGGLSVETTGDDSVRAAVTVTNTGARAGKYVVQVYVATQAGPVRRPARELRAFTKVRLEPGESRTVAFDLGRRAFAYYDVQGAGWTVAPGDYLVQIGENAEQVIAETSVSLAGDAVGQELTLESTLGEWIAHPVVGATLLQELTAALPDDQGSRMGDRPELLQAVRDVPMKRVTGLAGDALDATLERLMERTRAVGRP
ncbi:glycoside hydrolase family 3 C-terminal domain-containing protein [Streptomyces griseiscabiei]|uniref:Glycoside hydrolase family 3 C-terminal domain-containing protein n=1 Tax=Streptomyces griseiscabiei TaxID=2993540 RepID=A0ABU4L4D4_9ACTN|nr:glycoside hydrolase family 3 C-terminal domain-containing protein [Streptomyces griseiscabiei]MBZ3905495.1 glycoside hydrolase family 3 C-terminal domain-containing protein [Streptomyces griseiscabiei]MDX2910586.1 glycoside hydrolase family 3 C-terminal domain-containing protein [Streptomyces griseiscabiei]